MSRTIEEVVLERALVLMDAGPCEGTLARNARGKEVSPFSKHAIVFCASGAILRAYGELRNIRRQKSPKLFEACEIVDGIDADLPGLNDEFGSTVAKKLLERRLRKLRG